MNYYFDIFLQKVKKLQQHAYLKEVDAEKIEELRAGREKTLRRYMANDEAEIAELGEQIAKGADGKKKQALRQRVEELQQRDIRVRKMLCGIGHTVSTPDGDIETRSVMIADLDKATSLSLQETGVGPGRHLGCGIFLPHKGIRAVGETEDKSHCTGT